MTADAPESQGAYPDMRDPRVMVAVPHARRERLDMLWELAERLASLLRETREPLIGQIKLAWWRDMLARLAADPGDLPKGEPLLAKLEAGWPGTTGLGALVDEAEALLFAETGEDRQRAAAAFGDTLFRLSGGEGGGARWGMVFASLLGRDEDSARGLLEAACNRPTPRREHHDMAKPLLILDRWAHSIACRAGERQWRREGLLLLRLGIFGR